MSCVIIVKTIVCGTVINSLEITLILLLSGCEVKIDSVFCTWIYCRLAKV